MSDFITCPLPRMSVYTTCPILRVSVYTTCPTPKSVYYLPHTKECVLPAPSQAHTYTVHAGAWDGWRRSSRERGQSERAPPHPRCSP